MFAAATNTPLACTTMGLELFQVGALPHLAVGCVVAYVSSGHRGIYGAQGIDTPKPRWAGTIRPGRCSAMRLGAHLDIDTSRGARYGSARPFFVPSVPVHAPSSSSVESVCPRPGWWPRDSRPRATLVVFEPNGHDERTSDTDRRGGIVGSEGAASGPTTTVIVPADLRFLEVIRCSVRIALDDSGCDAGCTSDLQLACDELGGMLITSARIPGDLQLAVTEDGLDAYVRMTVPVATSGFRPPVPDLTRMLLDATADSYEVRTDGEVLVGVIQREIARSSRPSS